ncbi:MAG: TIR domain-containing protein [Planctomycetales bacterium]
MRRRGSDDELQPCARQNVIFEAGYLVAQFRGQGRVCFLLKKPMEMPSDLTGLLYEQFESIQSSRDRINRVLAGWKLLSPHSK